MLDYTTKNRFYNLLNQYGDLIEQTTERTTYGVITNYFLGSRNVGRRVDHNGFESYTLDDVVVTNAAAWGVTLDLHELNEEWDWSRPAAKEES